MAIPTNAEIEDFITSLINSNKLMAYQFSLISMQLFGEDWKGKSAQDIIDEIKYLQSNRTASEYRLD